MVNSLEARANALVLSRFANASILLAGVEVPIIFDDAALFAHVGVVGFDAGNPQFVAASAAVPAGLESARLTIRNQAYQVARVRPDGNGFTLVNLDLA